MNNIFTKKNFKRMLKASLISLDFPEGIKIKANEKILEIEKSLGCKTREEGNNRKYITLVAIYSAYQSLDIFIDMVMIANKIGIKKKNITKAFNKFSEAKTGVKIVYSSPDIYGYATYICSQILDYPDAYTLDLVNSLRSFILLNEKSKINCNPKSYATGYIKHYVFINSGRILKTGELSEKLKICATSVNNAYTNITNLYNSTNL